MSDLLRKAYRLGFEASGEGYNGEYPFAGVDLERDALWISMRDDDLSDLAAPVAAPVQVKALPTQKEMNQAFYVDVCRAEDRLNEIIELGKALLDSLPEHWHDDAVLNFKDAIDGVVVASSRRAVIQECIDVVETMGPDRLDGLMSRKRAIAALLSLISGDTSK